MMRIVLAIAFGLLLAAWTHGTVDMTGTLITDPVNTNLLTDPNNGNLITK